MIEYKDMHWEGDELFYWKKNTSIKLVRDENFHDHFWIEWNFTEPMISVRAYNITNAKDNARKLYLRYRNNITENSLRKAQGAI